MDKDEIASSRDYADLADDGGRDQRRETTWWMPTSRISPTPANIDVMNQLCRVCGEPAAGFHFGAFTCEGCKSFFGRTYNNLGSISECKNGGVCVINKKNRTACKACRLRKCLVVGMSKSGSRYGRRSNWFKIHCLLQEQSHHAQSRLLRDPKTTYEKVFASLDVANNNDAKSGIRGCSNSNITRSSSGSSSSNHNNNSDNINNNNNVVGTESYHRPSSFHNSSRHLYQDTSKLRSKRHESQIEKPQVVETVHTANQDALRFSDLGRTTHDILRPEISRFPMWHGPPFIHPALTHMQLLSAPFFTFQQRLLVPYQSSSFGGPQVLTGPSSSSSESVSPRSTSSPKAPENPISQDTRKNGTNTVVMVQEIERVNMAHEKILTYLRSLGPEQLEPIDLSVKSRETTSRMIDQNAARDIMDERGFTDTDNSALLQDIAPPLDLTRKT